MYEQKKKKAAFCIFHYKKLLYDKSPKGLFFLSNGLLLGLDGLDVFVVEVVGLLAEVGADLLHGHAAAEHGARILGGADDHGGGGLVEVHGVHGQVAAVLLVVHLGQLGKAAEKLSDDLVVASGGVLGVDDHRGSLLYVGDALVHGLLEADVGVGGDQTHSSIQHLGEQAGHGGQEEGGDLLHMLFLSVKDAVEIVEAGTDPAVHLMGAPGVVVVGHIQLDHQGACGGAVVGQEDAGLQGALPCVLVDDRDSRLDLAQYMLDHAEEGLPLDVIRLLRLLAHIRTLLCARVSVHKQCVL